MAISIDSAVLFYASIIVAGVTAVLGSWWITGYYSQSPNHEKWKWKTGRFLTIIILFCYAVFLLFMVYLQLTANTTTSNASNVTIINNYFINNSYYSYNISNLSIENCHCPKYCATITDILNSCY